MAVRQLAEERKKIMYKIPSLLDMLKAGAHFGHRPSKRHPKMEPFLFAEKGNVSIINLESTQEKLNEALEFVKEVAKNNGIILFVGSKRQAKPIIKKYAEETGMPYVIERWLGGTFTNYNNVFKLINKLKKIEAEILSGELKKYTKKEQLDFEKEVIRLNTLVGGVKQMTKVPEAIFIVDLKKEKTAFREALKTKVKTIALVDANINPEKVDYPIPCNDDATKAIEMITGLVAEAIKAGREGK
jgi:small subunit ribosomal protein S2